MTKCGASEIRWVPALSFGRLINDGRCRSQMDTIKIDRLFTRYEAVADTPGFPRDFCRIAFD